MQGGQSPAPISSSSATDASSSETQSDAAPATTDGAAAGSSAAGESASADIAPSSAATGADSTGSGEGQSGFVDTEGDPNFVDEKTNATYWPSYDAPTGAIPNGDGWPFNSTVAITVDARSPMLDFDVGVTPLEVDAGTGYRTFAGGRNGTAYLHFVGVGYGMNGTAEYRPGTDPKLMSLPPVGNTLHTFSRLGPTPDVTVGDYNSSLGEHGNLTLAFYTLELDFVENSKLSFHNATIYLPVKTQA